MSHTLKAHRNIETLSLNESDATDLLSEVLYQDPQLNERIVEFMFNNISN
jgi:hypothetical protein